MVSTLRLAVTCLAIGASASHAGQDASNLVQGALRVHGPEKTISMNQVLGRKYKIKSKQLVKGFARAFLSDGARWSKLLWGNATEVPAAAAPAVSATAGCNDADRQGMRDAIESMQNELMSALESKLPEIMGQMQDQINQMGDGDIMGGGDIMGDMMAGAQSVPSIPFSVDGSDMQGININVGDLLNLPESCNSIVDSNMELNWEGVKSCAQEALHVSDTCMSCIPAFSSEVSQCGGQCRDSMAELAEALDSQMVGMQDKVMKTASRSFGGMPSQSDMEGMADEMAQGMSSALKKFLPCSECFAPKAVSFAQCMGGQEAGEWMKQTADDIDGALRNGDLLKVAVGGPDSAEGDDTPALEEPEMPM